MNQNPKHNQNNKIKLGFTHLRLEYMKMEVVVDVCVHCGWWLVVDGVVAGGCGGGRGCPWG